MSDRVLGSELRVGDTIECWWHPGRDTIIGLDTYRGPYQDGILKGERIAAFGILRVGMTIEADADFTVIARGDK